VFHRGIERLRAVILRHSILSSRASFRATGGAMMTTRSAVRVAVRLDRQKRAGERDVAWVTVFVRRWAGR